MPKRKPKPETVEVVKSSYQPTKAEREEEFSVDVPGETVQERMSYIGMALMQKPNVKWVDKPGKE